MSANKTSDGHKPQFGSPVADYHKWFAWHPVRTWDFRLVWLRVIYRRKIQKHDHLTGGPLHWWEYSIANEGIFK